MYDSGSNGSAMQASVAVSAALGSELTQLLLADDIVPGSAPGYELCKTIYAMHPLGPVLADAPISRAQAMPREIRVPRLGESRLVEQFERVWNDLGKVGATVLLHNLGKTARIYGIASIGVGEVGRDTQQPLRPEAIAKADLYFNVLDPLNTAGSLVLNQDPNAPDFLKPAGGVHVQGKPWHPSRLCIKMNEQPLYIEWSSSAFGFVGRSVYQRALFPLKTFVQSMVTDQMVTQKAGLLVAKLVTPGSFIDNVMQTMFGWKRSSIKAGVTNQVLQIGVDESIETLDMQNLDKAAAFARTNALKNIATACGMPASIIAQETLTEGFGEGTEDAKKEAQYLNYVRADLQPAYDFMDRIVMRRAWSPEFYETMRATYPDAYGKTDYATALADWMHAFTASWPNLLVEPDSERSKTADVKLKAVVAIVETISPLLDPENAANLVEWVAENVNEADDLFSGNLDIDPGALLEHLQAKAAAVVTEPEAGEEPRLSHPFAQAS